MYDQIHLCGFDPLSKKDILTPAIYHCYKENKVTSVSYSRSWGTSSHVAFITGADELYAYGDEVHGRLLGHGKTHDQSTPTLVEALSGVVCKEVEFGCKHTTAVLTEAGKVYTFDEGSDGHLGHGNEEARHVNTLVRALETVAVWRRLYNGFE